MKTLSENDLYAHIMSAMPIPTGNDMLNLLASARASTTASTSTLPPREQSAAELIAEIEAGVARINSLFRPSEEALERYFREHGFDITAGDMMVLPAGTNLAGVPPRYRNQVVTSAHAKQVMLMKPIGLGLPGL